MFEFLNNLQKIYIKTHRPGLKEFAELRGVHKLGLPRPPDGSLFPKENLPEVFVPVLLATVDAELFTTD